MKTKIYYDLEFLEGSQTERFLGIELRIWNTIICYAFAILASWFTAVNAIRYVNGLEVSQGNRFGFLFSWGMFSYYAWNGKTERWINKTTIDLISIGMVSEDNREYYAISKDFNLREAWERYQWGEDDGITQTPKVYWIRENVLLPIFKELSLKERTEYDFPPFLPAKAREFNYKNLKRLIKIYGKTNAEIAKEVERFCRKPYTIQPQDKPNYMPIELYGYYSAYDHVGLCWLFGVMNDLPSGFPMYTIDLKQMLDEKIKDFKREDFFTAFDFANEGLPELTADERLKHIKMHTRYPSQTNEHSAIHDARFNRDLHIFIQSL